MKLLSEAVEYALRAVVYLADHADQPQKVHQIAETTRATPGYLVKVLQSLARAGIVASRRGLHGGFVLTREPRSLTILEVVNAIDPLERIQHCPLGLGAHTHGLCPLHHRIDAAIATIETSFARTTIADIISAGGHLHPLCEADSTSETRQPPEHTGA